MWWSRLKWPFPPFWARCNNKLSWVEIEPPGFTARGKVWQLFVVFYYGPGHAHVYFSYLCAGASQMKEHTGSCGQCRTVHEGFKPQSPCFLYGINKNFACTGQGERGHNFALLIPQRHGVGDHTLRDVMQLLEVAKVSFQLETSSYYWCSFLTRTFVISQRHRGITRCDLLNTLPLLEPSKDSFYSTL